LTTLRKSIPDVERFAQARSRQCSHFGVKAAQISRHLPSCARHAGLCYTSCMIIGVSQITLHLPGCHSLKDKRQIIKSVMARVRQQFEVAIAEVDEQDRWQIAILGVSCVSNSSQHIDEILGRVRRYIEETRPDIIVTNVEVEIINW
jgi:uncharacterized protein YlxP (DUF503 family)